MVLNISTNLEKEMGRILTLIIMFLIIALNTSYVSAQGIVAKGFKGGINLANVSSDDVDDPSSKLGFAIGGFITFNLMEQILLRPEIYYTSTGFKSTSKESESDTDYEYSYTTNYSVTLNYLKIPVLGVFALNKNFNIFAVHI